MSWFSVFKHVLPHATAWRLVIDRKLRQFFVGLTPVFDDVQADQDVTWNDYRPFQTTKLSNWEIEFALLQYGLTDQQRRSRLDAAWKALGGQDPNYIQSTLQAFGFNVFVHEWWEPIIGRSGGSINNDVIPVARNPLTFLDDESDATKAFLMNDGAESAQDGDTVAQDGSSSSPAGYPLVNKITIATDTVQGDGNEVMQDGRGQDGGGVVVFTLRQYTIPNDVTKFPFFLYIGGATFPEQATVSQNRRGEFEDLCLKICPTEQWLGILVDYA